MKKLFDRLILAMATWSYIATVAVFSGMHRRRMTHNNGCLARGHLRIVDQPSFPAHPMFPPGQVYPCRIRHAAALYEDDGCRTVRSASIKFADTQGSSPLDILMNTGVASFFWTAYHFFQSAYYRRPSNGFSFLKYFQICEGARVAARDAFRWYPPSFAEMHYHSQTVFSYTGLDQVPRYVKYRLLPGDRGPDVGLAPSNKVDTPETLSDFRSNPEDPRNRNYLKEEYVERLKAGPIRYWLQLQWHDVKPDDSPEILNSNVPWDESTSPWHDLAEVTIEESLDYEESVLTWFSIHNAPKSLGVLPSYSIHDYNSINHVRSRGSLARRSRLFWIQCFGLPKPNPDDGPRNSQPPGT